MAKAIIQFMTKNHALFGGAVTIDTHFAPRVGELIGAKQFLEIESDEVGNFMVESVIYLLENGELCPAYHRAPMAQRIPARAFRAQGLVACKGHRHA